MLISHGIYPWNPTWVQTRSKQLLRYIATRPTFAGKMSFAATVVTSRTVCKFVNLMLTLCCTNIAKFHGHRPVGNDCFAVLPVGWNGLHKVSDA